MISAVILTKNNEKTLGKTLASVSFCDDILIVDDNSSDNTVAVARKYKATVIVHPLDDDFAKQRNFGLEKVKGDWVLFVDSDEIVSEGLRKEILQKLSIHRQGFHLRQGFGEQVGGQVGGQAKLKNQKEEINGYFIKRTDYLLGQELKHGETSQVKLLRLAKKDTGVWVRPVHEVWEVKGKTETLANPLFHYPHSDVAQFLSDINRYSTLNAKYFYEEGVRVHWWQIVLYPKAKFFVNYITKLGFLDGTAGMVVALMMSFHSFLTRGKIWELQKKN